MNQLNPTAVIFWAILGCVGFLVGRDAVTTVSFVLAGMILSLLAGALSR